MEFFFSIHNENGFKWEQWDCSPYRIVCFRPGEYLAYYKHGSSSWIYVSKPPRMVRCRGCRTLNCSGFHLAWVSVKDAQEACLEHYAALPW